MLVNIYLDGNVIVGYSNDFDETDNYIEIDDKRT